MVSNALELLIKKKPRRGTQVIVREAIHVTTDPSTFYLQFQKINENLLAYALTCGCEVGSSVSFPGEKFRESEIETHL